MAALRSASGITSAQSPGFGHGASRPQCTQERWRGVGGGLAPRRMVCYRWLCMHTLIDAPWLSTRAP